jgi:hypothetical protein
LIGCADLFDEKIFIAGAGEWGRLRLAPLPIGGIGKSVTAEDDIFSGS